VGTDLYPHMPILLSASVRGLRAGRFAGRFWASGGAKFTKMGDSLTGTPLNRPAKFGAASFILGGEIRNRTHTHSTHKQYKKRHVWITSLDACIRLIVGADQNRAHTHGVCLQRLTGYLSLTAVVIGVVCLL